MYVGAVHTIRDRGRWEEMMRTFDPAALPTGTELLATGTSAEVDRAVCVWRAPDVASLQRQLDDLAGEFAHNDLFALTEEFVLVNQQHPAGV